MSTIKTMSPSSSEFTNIPHLIWHHTQKKVPPIFFFLLGGVMLAYVLLVLVKNTFSPLFLPNTYIDGVDVSFLTKAAALEKVSAESLALPDVDVEISVDDIVVSSSSASLGIRKNVEMIISEAFDQKKTDNALLFAFNVLHSLATEKHFTTQLTFNQQNMQYFLTLLAEKVDIIGIQPQASLGIPHVANTLEINPGSIGRKVEVLPSIEVLLNNYSQEIYVNTAVVASTAAELSDEEITTSYEYARSFLEKDVIFTGPDHTKKTLTDQDIISVLNLPSGVNQDAVQQLVSEWEETLNRDPVDAIFDYDKETLTVEEFVPDRPGISIKSRELTQMIIDTIEELQRSTPEEASTTEYIKPLPITTLLPARSLASTNDLGIIQRIGYGDSEYAHSIPNRIHNVELTAEKISNTLIAPGQEFSFNQSLGDVSRASGFKSAYVIKNGKTILGDGGGVCQVSTTLFRALLDAGLQITRRIPHSYRVSYYELDEKPGIDATVYSGNVDLRFINDTDNYVLLHSAADSENLTMYVELYGTSDGRTTEIKDHLTYGYRPPLPPEYADDPSLPPGALRQVDWAAAGISAKFTHIIKNKDGEVLSEKEYLSNYRPWAAKFLRGV